MFLNENGEEGKLIGQNIFMRTTIKSDDGRNIPIMTMGPICITSELKRQGYGKALLDYLLDKAAKLGCGAVCFEGNIDFYGKVDLSMQVNLTFVIMDWKKGRMHLSFCAKS